MRFITDPIKTAFFTILFIFLGLFIYTTLAGPIPFFVNSVQTNKSDYFRVEGVGEATAVPDTAVISFGVTKTAPTVSTAQQQANTVINQITKGVKDLGIEDKNIKTTNYSVYPNYSFAGEKQTIDGYTVTQNISVNIKPIDKANQAIDIATAAGANLVGSISFTLDAEAKKDLQQKARDEAVKNAKEKAQSLSEAAGISLGKIIDIQEFPTYNAQSDMTMAVGGMNKAESAPTEINPGETTISTTVSLGYQLQ